MKVYALVVTILILAMTFQAQVGTPTVLVVGVSTPGGCPTPTFTGGTTVVVECGAPDGLYISTVQHPVPVLLGATGGTSVKFSDITGQLAASQLPLTTTCNVTGNITLTGGTLTSSGCK